MVLVWLGTLHTNTVHKRRIDLSREARSKFVNQCLENSGVQDLVDRASYTALVRLEVTDAIDHMLHITDQARQQLAYWEHVLDVDLSSPIALSTAYRFKIVQVLPLARPVPVGNYTQRKKRGFVVQLDELQGATLLQQLRSQGMVPSWVPADSAEIADVVVRLPSPFAALCSAGKWRSFVLPHCQARAGSSAMEINWPLLQMGEANLPRPRRGHDHIPLATCMDVGVADRIADHLRAYANTLDLDGESSQCQYDELAY